MVVFPLWRGNRVTKSHPKVQGHEICVHVNLHQGNREPDLPLPIPGQSVPRSKLEGPSHRGVSLERAPPRGAGAQGRPGVPGGVGTLRKTFQQGRRKARRG